MARIRQNIVLQGLSGLLGGQLVIRKQHGGYCVAVAPPRVPRPSTPAQAAQRDRFRRAAAYAKAAQGRPEYQAPAAERQVPAYVVALGDWLNAPKVLGIDVSGYDGGAGQRIAVTAVDDVQVALVAVRIGDGAGAAVEEGTAVQSPADLRVWVYTTTTGALATPVRIRATAIDLAGQVGVREVQG
jgi:hypothetical protein